jgi:hypothetical protein
MNNKIVISSPASGVIAVLAILLSTATILSIYFHVPYVINPSAIKIYEVMGADFNAMTMLTHKFYAMSYILLLLVALISAVIVYLGRKRSVGLGLLSLLFVSLLLCVAWRELMEVGMHSMIYELRMITNSP